MAVTAGNLMYSTKTIKNVETWLACQFRRKKPRMVYISLLAQKAF